MIALGRRTAPLDELKSKLEPSKVLSATCDITNRDDIIRIAKLIASDAIFGKTLTVVVNNAGIFERRTFKDSSDETWEKMFSTHLLGPVRLVRALLPTLEANRGAIINVSSTLGLRPVSQTSAYSALKAAMINWTETLAIELGPSGVRANCVCPGIVDTPIHGFHTQTDDEKLKSYGRLQPLGRIGRPEDVAYAIWSLCGPGSEWMTGSILKVDGGIHLV